MAKQELVTYAKFHDFKNEDGQLLQGGKIYLLGKRVDISNEFGAKCGYPTAAVKTTKELAAKVIEKGPGLYNLDYDFAVDRDGNLVPELVGVEFVKDYKFF